MAARSCLCSDSSRHQATLEVPSTGMSITLTEEARGGRRAPAKGQGSAAISTAAISTAAISTAVTAVVHNTTVRGGTERVARRSEVRGRDYATNVLTFDGVREAGVPVPAHCAHLVVHGVLHTRAGL